MSDLLKILSPESFPIDLAILGKTINIKPYSHGDVKGFLLLLDDYKKNKKGGIKKLFQAQQNLIDACILPDATGQKPVQACNLHRADYIHIMTYLKMITHGEKTEVRFRCSNLDCENEETKQRHIETFDFIWEDVEFVGCEKIDEVSFERQDGQTIKIKMKPYTFQVLTDNSDLFEAEMPSVELMSKFQASFIADIEVGEQLFCDLPMSEKSDFITMLEPKYKKFIANWIDSEARYVWKKEWICPTCEAKNISEMKEVHDFFV